MKKQLSLLLMLTLTIVVCYGQDSARIPIGQDSTIRTMPVRGPRYYYLVYSANGQILSRRQLISRLELYPGSAEQISSYRRADTGILLWLTVMLGSGITAAVERGNGNEGARYTFGGIAVGALVAALISGGRKGRHFNEAVAAYNKHFRD